MQYAKIIDIVPIISKEIVYAVPISDSISNNEENKGIYLPIDEVDKNTYKILSISGTEQRKMLEKNMKIPEWFSFPDVIEELKKEKKEGFCLYFIGLPSAGKSTLANFMISKLKELMNKKITLLDGDIVRTNLSKELGFSKKDRSTHVRRIGYVCSEIVKHNGIVCTANIAPYDEDRKYNRNIISEHGNYIEIFVDSKLETCEKRDPKGLYDLAKKGIIKEFTGISDPFEKPENSEIILCGENDINYNINIIIEYLIKNDILKN